MAQNRIRSWTAIALLLAAVLPAPGQQPAPYPDSGLMAELAQPKQFEARRESSAKKDLAMNMDREPIEPGETTVLGELEGPGAITHLWCFAHTQNPLFSRALVLRIYWDGAEHPSVEAPLGDFFAVGHGGYANVNSAVVSVTAFGRSRNCFWNMPFRKSARVTITNESTEHRIYGLWYKLNWRKYDALPDDTPYFHARYRQECPAKPGDYTILETEGRGHYVGTVLSVQQMDRGWFGEGDERFYIDGEDYPSLSGTGTEEYFGYAWGLRPFDGAYFGVPLFDGHYPGDRASAYRWHLLDPIPFKKSLKLTIEHYGGLTLENLDWVGGFFETTDWFSSVAFWYQTPVATFEECIPPLEERLAPYRVIDRDDMTIRTQPRVELDEDGNYHPGTPEAAIEYSFEVKQAGCYQINAMMGYMFTGAMYQTLVDGQTVGVPRDYGFAGEDTGWECFDYHKFGPGVHTLRFECRGLSPSHRTLYPKKYTLRLDRLILLRLEDMEGYGEMERRVMKERAGK
jgi:D-arabinan exo alpha-(1,3)/(1,5)-arabinofuranosidase (non-reducing end)